MLGEILFGNRRNLGIRTQPETAPQRSPTGPTSPEKHDPLLDKINRALHPEGLSAPEQTRLAHARARLVQELRPSTVPISIGLDNNGNPLYIK